MATRKRIGENMKFTKKLGMTLLAVWLIAFGAGQLFEFSSPVLSVIMGILAIAAGLLLLLGK